MIHPLGGILLYYITFKLFLDHQIDTAVCVEFLRIVSIEREREEVGKKKERKQTRKQREEGKMVG